ncbi:MAG: 30S ribosomal protein S17 [Rickettsiales bacterium]|nr:30S ribosomal protein S17 [Rickettsiales bacterium]
MNTKKLLAKKTTTGVRYFKNVGLGFRTPKEAIESTYVDKKCPFTSNVSIRGKILKGICISTKMQRTIVVRRDYLHYVPKYNRYEKRHRNISVHCSPAFNVKEGDIIVIGECRPLCKTVSFNVLKVIPHVVIGNVRKQFMLF